MNIGKSLVVAFILLLAARLALAQNTAPRPPSGPMQIGVIIPQSWPDKARGEEIRNGMLMALKTLATSQPPTLQVKDSACKPQQAQAAAQALLAAKVDVVIGGFCIVGPVPAMLQAAGVPFISANAERLNNVSDTTLQMGHVPVNMAPGIAAKLRAETGLRVTADGSCWIDYEARVPKGYDAALCPTLRAPDARWNEQAAAYSAAFRKPFTVDAARGYAAMQVALAAVKQMRAGSKPATALRDAKDIDTLLGRFSLRDERPVPDDAMLLSLAPALPRLAAREQRALDEMLKTKGCGCRSGVDCPRGNPWSTLPFIAQCAGAGHPAMALIKY